MGSLFKLRDFWSLNTGEEFSSKGMCVGNVDNEANGAHKIVIGSFQGVLRILCPKNQKGFRAEDVLLEKRFAEPILQVAVGNFLNNNSNRNVLAVLFPRKLLLATVTRLGPQQGSDTDGGQMTNFFLQLTSQMEYRFDHTTFNLTYGTFGNSTSEQEYLCVQSMDGQVSFVDHNKIMFQRFLPSAHFLVPGTLTYVPKMDAFLTSSSSFEVHCYKYSTFAQSTGSEKKDNPAAEGRKISVDWAFNVGEDVIEIQHCRLTRELPNTQVDIVVLCERTVFVLSEAGALKYNRRLDAAALCLLPYVMPGGRQHNLLIGTSTNLVTVYDDATLRWGAKSDTTPVSLAVATLCGTQGMIVVLGDCGTLSVNYLGTDPASNPVQVLESKELDYDAMDSEHRRLQAAIRQAVGSSKAEPVRDFIRLKAEVHAAGVEVNQTNGARSCRVSVNIVHTGPDATKTATLVTSVGPSLSVNQPSVSFASLPAGQTTTTTVVCFPMIDNDCLIPSTLVADFVLSFTGAHGEQLTAKTACLLPLALAATPVPPLKNIQFKTQIDTNKSPPPPLHDLFADLVPYGEIGANVLSIQYSNGSDATVLVSKNAGRYRVQSSSFDGLWLLTSELVRRLKQWYKADDGTSDALRIDVPEGIPLEEYLSMIDMHCLMRVELHAAQQRLSEVAHLFRAIQKRLLVRFRDRNPTPLVSIELLFEDTYRRLHVCADDVELASSRLRQAAAMLSCSTHLVLLLLKYRCQDTFTREDLDIFKHYLSPCVPHSSTSGSLGWAEITDANMTHLLRTALSRSAKESNSVPQPLVPSTDSGKVKKHLTIVFDRIGKGATLTGNAFADAVVPDVAGGLE